MSIRIALRGHAVFAYKQKIRLRAVDNFSPSFLLSKKKVAVGSDGADSETIIIMNIFSKIGKTTVEKNFTEAF